MPSNLKELPSYFKAPIYFSKALPLFALRILHIILPYNFFWRIIIHYSTISFYLHTNIPSNFILFTFFFYFGAYFSTEFSAQFFFFFWLSSTMISIFSYELSVCLVLFSVINLFHDHRGNFSTIISS